MGRSVRPARGRGNGSKRGRHKRHSSPETATWERDHLPPERPPWIAPELYVRLLELRGEL